MDCPLKTPWQAPIWNLRWSPPDTAKDPNIIAPLKVAEAAAAQLPISAIRNMARLGMEIYIKKIPRWPMGELVYTECYGPIPP
jgi:hypothetical protein